ncbi:MAG: response regulator [Candidatus Aminicenantes bacterium]|nr:response regulator [Candidatus Aminicenantes bacterium]
MKKKIIALADNSYTIRRIVELSFSEIENIEVHSFENGTGLKEKLLRLEPDVLIVDIKLPETSGYDLCRFINETPALNRCRVFLMKGSFEAVDNEMIKNLKYEDIVTKPFDSNALVSSVMKNLSQEEPKAATEFAEEEPSSFPEDIMEIETDAPVGEGINFSDIRLDVGAQAGAGSNAPQNQVPERDEILPSEEITQGTQPPKDTLLPTEPDEAIQNPFKEEPLAEETKLPADEITAPMTAKPEKKPAGQNTPAESMIRDISDEFHERFQKAANGDTSDALIKSSLEATRMADRRDFKFSVDREDKIYSAAKKDTTGSLNDSAGDAPKKAMYSEKDEIFDFGPSSQKQGKEKGAEGRMDKLSAEELFVQKIRPETISPEAELKKLSQTPPREREREAKSEPQTDGGLTVTEKIDLTGKLEDKLTLTIKELIWEIVPSLAEKIIKEEIDKIKAEANDTDF